MQADHKIHSGWGHHIEFMDGTFDGWKGEMKNFRVFGHLPRIPKEGETLIGEFENSFIKFQIQKVDRCFDPPDMFFADVVPIEQELKKI